MSANLKAYEQQQFAKHHYRKLISAKTTLGSFHSNNQSIPLSRTMTPLDKYQYKLTNDKIRNKLTEIYQESTERTKERRKRKKRKCKSVNFGTLEKQKTLKNQNVRMYQKIIQAKSTICNFKDRQKELKKYSRITRKKHSQPDQNLFRAFRQILIESRGASKRSLRPSSGKIISKGPI